jgi:hypothetical protein
MSGQVVNNLSLNILGGYTGGVNGLELGGLFNLDKRNVQYLQAAGLFNVVGGNVKGLQAGGINNTVLGSVVGLQAGGISNFARQGLSGVQVAGVANMSHGDMKGLQVSGVFNYAKRLRGVQIGLINIAGESDGYSFGLINIVFKGYHKLSFSSNEITNVNVAFKAGNRKLYSILQAGANVKENEKVYSFGYGLGSDMPLAKWLYINPELSANYLYLGAFDYVNILSKANLHLNFKLGKYLSIFAGPSFNAYYMQQDVGFSGYKFSIPDARYKTIELHNKVSGWIGWNAGINLF